MPSGRHVIVAGGGIAGLTAALCLSRAGFRATVLEQSPRLEEIGAGIQLSPNATRILLELGLHDYLAPLLSAPDAIRVSSGGSGREITRIPLGAAAVARYGAPFWTLHRGDLQSALFAACENALDVEVKLGLRLDDFAAHGNGITAQSYRDRKVVDDRANALIGADGIWSHVAGKLGRQRKATFAHRTAWRALVRMDAMPEAMRGNLVNLWLGHDAHLVMYPMRAGRLMNMVGIVRDEWNKPGWQAAGDRGEILRAFARFSWDESVRKLIAIPERWQKWALYDRQAPFAGGEGPVSLIGDAAHPMLPFLAQGAGMAIEDGAVLAACLKNNADNLPQGLRAYEAARAKRTARVQQVSRQQGKLYSQTGPSVLIRNLGMKWLGGERLLKRYDWLYNWRAPS